MPRNPHFEQYQSPNIIIVPTVNFCLPPPPTGSVKIPDPIPNSPLKNYEEKSPVKNNIGEPSTSAPNCNQQNLLFVNTKASTSTPEVSENVRIRNSPSILKNTISTKVSSCNMSLKELSTSKFKSRNNLVDLTGFNLMKRNSASSLSKRQDFREIDDTKIKRDKTSTSSTDLRKKITEGSKKYRDHERRYISEYPNKSKSKTNSRHLPDAKVSIRHRGIHSPDSIRRYKDFQRSVRHYDDHEIKYKRENENKTKHLVRKKIRIESCETTKIKPDVKKKESKQHATCQKSEKRAELSSTQSNLEKGKNNNNIKAKHPSNSNKVFIKSVLRGDKNLSNNLSQRKNVDGVEDLRSRLSRKRSSSECFEHHEATGKKFDRKTLLIPVKQDVEVASSILAPTLYEPEPKTRKPNELINKKCPTSDSDDSDEDSLLDYFMNHGDEIVASMYKPEHSETEPMDEQEISDNKNSEEINLKTGLINNMKSIEINKEETNLHKVMEINSINKTNENDNKSNEDTKSKMDLSNHVNKKAIKITQEEETSMQNQVNNQNEKNKPKGLIFKVYMRVVKINSDTENEDENREIGSIAYTRKHKDVKDVDQNPKIHRNSQQVTNNTMDITKKVFEELVPKDTIGICNDKLELKTNSQIDRSTEQQATNIIASTEKAYEENAPKETISLCKDKQKIITKSKMEIKEKTNNIIDLTENTYGEIKPKETMSICKDKQKIKNNLINKENTKQETNNTIDLTGKNYKEIAPKVIKSLSMDKQKITLNSSRREKNNIIDLTRRAYEENAPKETIEISDSNDSVVEVIDITGMTPKHVQPNVNRAIELNHSKKPSRQTMCNIDQNKTINNPGVKYDVLKLLNNLKKQVKDKNDNAKDNVEASLETMFNKLEQKSSIHKHIAPKQIHGCVKKLNENSIQKSVDAVEVTLETIFNGTKQHDTCINMGTQKTSLSGQLINKDVNVLKTAQATIEVPPETEMNMLDQNENVNQKMKIELSNVTYKNILTELESANQILPETTKNSINKQDVAIKIDAGPLNVSNIQKNRSQISGMDIVPLCKSNMSFREHEKIFENTVNKLINKIEKKTQNVLNSVSENKLLLGSDNSSKDRQETPKSSLVQNNEVEAKIVQKCKTIQTSSKTISNDEQKTSTTKIKSNMSDKNTVIKPDKSKEETSEQKPIVKTEKALAIKYKEFITSINKTDVKNQNKTQATMKNNTQNPQSKEDTVSNTKISKDCDLKKQEIVTNTNTGQEKTSANNSLVPINKDDTKSNMQEKQLSPKMRSSISKLETQIFEYLQTKYTLSSLIHRGRFSTIYRCFDAKGEPYAVKVVNQLHKGKLMEKMFSVVQQQRPRQDSFVLFLVNTFEYQNQWCLLTEYFPKNLQQVLHEKKQGFHIDRVQVLSRQLVDAVNMLTNVGIIHSDIKPTHILLNDANDKLKLCGFDRSDFSSSMRILPSTGSARYRAPEVILGFQEDHRIDVWSTALVIFEMATKKPLFDAYFNNGLLYQQLLTFGSFDWSMVEQSRFRDLYFSGTSFIRQLGRSRYEQIFFVESLHRTEYLRNQLFEPYSEQNRAKGKSRWQITKEMDKVETLHTLLKQMLTLDPRQRLPIQFVNASEFMNHNFTSA